MHGKCTLNLIITKHPSACTPIQCKSCIHEPKVVGAPFVPIRSGGFQVLIMDSKGSVGQHKALDAKIQYQSNVMKTIRMDLQQSHAKACTSHAMDSKWGTGGLPAVQHLVVRIGPCAALAALGLVHEIEGSSGVTLGPTSCVAITKIPARMRPICNAPQLVATSTVVASIMDWNLALVTSTPQDY
ncbi:hypothetical protein VNO77_19992 [Canavalia gladiata]|uniref:Uncharacterized protein n=1 Tax=Canavalia gladiata TaxID=3824 RepID=A0AAN9LNU2_CANGL